eukprot:TRINITY_DN64511_c0_g1_i1.p1 TRINITY_DN64511_c0_g1~~TRINITY_DN64511_c0_g1_i1.p1  ORF type:complete len:323 (+),score=38.56 TRINITY_DN64511_c0_g1_i1:183-1151(+)
MDLASFVTGFFFCCHEKCGQVVTAAATISESSPGSSEDPEDAYALPHDTQEVVVCREDSVGFTHENSIIDNSIVDDSVINERLGRLPPTKEPDSKVPEFSLTLHLPGSLPAFHDRKASIDSSASTAADEISWTTEQLSYRQPSSEPFLINVHREPGMPLGLDLDSLDSHSLLITKIKAGPFRIYNEGVKNSELKLKPKDAIVAINGVEGSSEALLQQLQSSQSVEMCIVRPKLVQINIDRAYRPLGLQVKHTSSLASGLLVSSIEPGVLRDWNVGNRREDGIQRRDRIFRVNGKEDLPAELLRMMKVAARDYQGLYLDVYRY